MLETIEISCLSVKQPYATLIAIEEKKYEIRTWRTNYRGPIAIASSAKPAIDGLPSGLLVCIVDIFDVIPMQKEHAKSAAVDFDPSALSWCLRNPFIVDEEEWGIKVKGQLGIYKLQIPVPLWDEYQEWKQEVESSP